MSRLQYLMPAAARRVRAQQKRLLILRFLRLEIWADVTNIGDLLQVRSLAATRALDKLLSEDLLRHHLLPTMGGHLILYGITAHGQAMTADAGEEVLDKVFMPSRVAPTYARHTLDIQMLRIRAERAGWTAWVNADRVDKWEAGQMRPDAFATSPQGKRVAIECERTIKSPKRYLDILNGWLQAIRKGEVDRIVWVSPDGRIRDRLKQIVTNITHLRIAGQEVLIPRDRFDNLTFLTYAEWPTSC